MQSHNLINCEVFVDNFELSEICSIIIIKSNRNAYRTFNNKEIKPHWATIKRKMHNMKTGVGILCKSSWMFIDFETGKGDMETKLSVSNLYKTYTWINKLNIITIESTILIGYIKMEYEPEPFIITCLNSRKWVIKSNNATNTRPISIYNSDKNINAILYSKCIIFSMNNSKSKDKAIRTEIKEGTSLENLLDIDNFITYYNILNEAMDKITTNINEINYSIVDPTDKYICADPITWYGGKRENQTLWPNIINNNMVINNLSGKQSNNKEINEKINKLKKITTLLEFPIKSGIYYYYIYEPENYDTPFSPQKLENFPIKAKKQYFPSLRIRSDDAPTTYIPCLTKINPLERKSTLKSYMENIKNNNNNLVSATKKLVINNENKEYKEYKEQTNTNKNNTYVLHILDNEDNIIKSYCINKKEWVDTKNKLKISETGKTAKWDVNYRQIIHDYISTNNYIITNNYTKISTIRSHIFNIKEAKNKPLILPDFIDIKEIYISPNCLETYRLLTFKKQRYVSTYYCLL